MHKQMDLNFVPCFFLRSSFILSSYKKRENGKVVRKQNARRRTKKEEQGEANLTKNWHLIYTVIHAIL